MCRTWWWISSEAGWKKQGSAPDDRSSCLENPRPEGAESSLTENAASPLQAEPAHIASAGAAKGGINSILTATLLHLLTVVISVHARLMRTWGQTAKTGGQTGRFPIAGANSSQPASPFDPLKQPFNLEIRPFPVKQFTFSELRCYHSLCSAYASPARTPNFHPLLSSMCLCLLPARGTCPDPPGTAPPVT